jgi:hypothetical protein
MRNTINEIAEKYTGHERAWLLDKNPVVMRQLDALYEKVEAAAACGVGLDKALMVWKQTWLFWIANYKQQKGLR